MLRRRDGAGTEVAGREGGRGEDDGRWRQIGNECRGGERKEEKIRCWEGGKMGKG